MKKGRPRKLQQPTQLIVWVEEGAKTSLEAASSCTGQTQSNLVRRAISSFLNSEELQNGVDESISQEGVRDGQQRPSVPRQEVPSQ